MDQPTEMRIKNIHERVNSIDKRVNDIDQGTTRFEQVLPIFATKDDLASTLLAVNRAPRLRSLPRTRDNKE